ncbi:MAG: hypothetical protein AAF602_10300 [Myxococcota bacterium]
MGDRSAFFATLPPRVVEVLGGVPPDDPPTPLPCMTPAERAIVTGLPADAIAAVDQRLLDAVGRRFTKIAAVILTAMEAHHAARPGLPLQLYRDRLLDLVERAEIEVRGDPMHVRSSEVRRTPATEDT